MSVLDRCEPVPEAGCWLFTGYTVNGGYGQTRLNGEHHLAHRLSWEEENGPIPDGMKVLHKCDTPRCCAPNHLFLGTQLDNARDCLSKGRHPGFRKNWRQKAVT